MMLLWEEIGRKILAGGVREEGRMKESKTSTEVVSGNSSIQELALALAWRLSSLQSRDIKTFWCLNLFLSLLLVPQK